MYNRYIPQADGSYLRSRQPEPKPPEAFAPRHTAPAADPVQELPPPPPPPQEPPIERSHRESRCDRCAFRTAPNKSVGGFLKQLLPKDFDTGDLIVVLLLLLMAGDSEEDKNNAILTLALYFLM